MIVNVELLACLQVVGENKGTLTPRMSGKRSGEEVMFIWKDLDPNNFIIGVKDTKKENAYVSWGCVFVDGLYELFGKEVAETMKNANPGQPVEFKITVEKETAT